MTPNVWYKYQPRRSRWVYNHKYKFLPTVTTTSDKIWYVWNNDPTSTTSYTIPVPTYDLTLSTNSGSTLLDEITWGNWLETPYESQHFNVIRRATPAWAEVVSPERHAELLAAQRERAERHEAARVADAAAREQARVKARVLLAEVLSPVQAAEFAQRGCFHVTSNLGNRFLVTLGRAHNVFQLDARGRRITEFCAHVGEYVPDEDNVLAQKLLLETDEATFRRIANKWSLLHLPDGTIERLSLVEPATVPEVVAAA